MKYSNNKRVLVGDKVQLGQGATGVVVCDFDHAKFSVGFSERDWSYLQRGVLVNFQLLGLVHYLEAEAELKLLERA